MSIDESTFVHSSDQTNNRDTTFSSVEELDGSLVNQDKDMRMSTDESVESSLSIDGSSPVTPAPAVLIPSLRGAFSQNNGKITCRGVWALSDEHHDIPGQTSDFEFKLIQAHDESFPPTGKYQGWFNIKQFQTNKNIKIDDKDMTIKFTKAEDGSIQVEGEGVNKFGRYDLRGTYNPENNSIQIYREYSLKPIATPSRKRQNSENALKIDTSNSNVNNNIIISNNNSNGNLVSSTPGAGINTPNGPVSTSIVSVPVTPRESSGRIRKQSSYMREYEEISHTPRAKAATPRTPKDSNISVATTLATPVNNIAVEPLAVGASVGSAARPSRNTFLAKCMDLVKEMSKIPDAIYFLEPVDHVKLNIPDYPTIITSPMDFRTIRENLEAGIYEGPEQFAEHMRLVFRNAITYNQFRDNPVNIAARDLNSRFEARFRTLLSNYNAMQYALQEAQFDAPTPRGTSSAKKARSSSGGSRAAVAGYGLGGVNVHRVNRTSQYGGIDPSMAQVADLQKKIAAMESEMLSLRTQLRQSEVKTHLENQREAARNPLTFEEKKILIQQIQQLGPEQALHVAEIIRPALPEDQVGQNGSIEIPVDSLDTFTLRKLKQYVESALVSPKSTLARSASAASLRSNNSNKRARTSRGKGAGGSHSNLSSLNSTSNVSFENNSGASNGMMTGDYLGSDDILVDSEMLFSNEFLEEDILGVHPDNSGTDTSSINQASTETDIDRLREIDRQRRELSSMQQSLLNDDDDIFG